MRRFSIVALLVLCAAACPVEPACSVLFQQRRLVFTEEDRGHFDTRLDYDEPEDLEGLRALEALIAIPRFNTSCIRQMVGGIACRYHMLPYYFVKVLCSMSRP